MRPDWMLDVRAHRAASEASRYGRRNRMSISNPLVRCSLLIAALASALWIPRLTAQVVTGDIVGTVTDANGAVLPGAIVMVVNTDTQLQRKMNTTSTGDSV